MLSTKPPKTHDLLMAFKAGQELSPRQLVRVRGRLEKRLAVLEAEAQIARAELTQIKEQLHEQL